MIRDSTVLVTDVPANASLAVMRSPTGVVAGDAVAELKHCIKVGGSRAEDYGYRRLSPTQHGGF